MRVHRAVVAVSLRITGHERQVRQHKMSRSTDRGNNFSVQSPHGGMRRTALSRTSVEMSTERSGAALLAEALLAEEASATRKPSAAADWTGVDAAYGAARSISQARSLSVASTA